MFLPGGGGNPNYVLTTCKAISKGLGGGFVIMRINGLEKKQNHGGRRRDFLTVIFW